MIGFKLSAKTVRVARAIGDSYVSYDHNDGSQYFVYYESDDTFEIMSESNFKRKFRDLSHGFEIKVFSAFSDESLMDK